MSSSEERQLAGILKAHRQDILTEWMQNQIKAVRDHRVQPLPCFVCQ